MKSILRTFVLIGIILFINGTMTFPVLAADSAPGWGVAAWKWTEAEDPDSVNSSDIEKRIYEQCNRNWKTTSMDEWTEEQIDTYLQLAKESIQEAMDAYNKDHKKIDITVAFTMKEGAETLSQYVSACQPYVYLTRNGEYYDKVYLSLMEDHPEYAIASLSVTGYGEYEGMICHNQIDGVPTAQNAQDSSYSTLSISIYNGGFSARSTYTMSEELLQTLTSSAHASVPSLPENGGSSGGGGGTTPADTFSFTDVPKDAWYYDAVMAATAKGLIKGRSETTFAPEDPVTYAEAITLAVRMHASDSQNTLDTSTEKGESWYAPYLRYAQLHDIPCDYAHYNEAIPRSDFVHIFYYSLPDISYPEVNVVADGDIPDVAMEHPYAEEIYHWYRVGMIQGDSDGNFYPEKNIKRSEVATIMSRMMDTAK